MKIIQIVKIIFVIMQVYQQRVNMEEVVEECHNILMVIVMVVMVH